VSRTPGLALCLSLLVHVTIPSPGFTQSRVTTADVTGVVLDPSRAVIPAARVRATHRETNVERTTIADGAGRFLIASLAPGTYQVTAGAPGFADRILDDLALALGSVVDLEITLQIAGIDTTVLVPEPSLRVDARRTVLSEVVSPQQIEGLPTNGRDFIAFTLITPGVSSDRTPQQGASATSGLTFAGQRGRANSILVDGLDNNDSAVGGVRAVFSQEAVREFQVLTSSFSAEFGKASGGIVNIVTRSGTNDPQGSAFIFVRDEHLNAKEYFEKFDPSGAPVQRPKASYGQLQFGGTASGPLRRDSTFYYAAYERLDVQANNFVNIDSTQVVTIAGQPVGTAVDILRNAGFPIETGNVPYDVISDQLFFKLNQWLGNGLLDVRFNWADVRNENAEPWGGLVARSRGGALESDDVMGAVSHTVTLTPTVFNELRTQVAYRDQTVEALDPSCSGQCDGIDEGGPTLEVTGVASVGRQRFLPQPRKTVRYQVLDTLSIQRGRDVLKLGVDYNYLDYPSGALPLHFGGRYVFGALPAVPGLVPAAVSAIQAVALGLPSAYVQGYGDPTLAYAVQDLSLFAQYDWSVGSDLTVKAGVRHQSQYWPSTPYIVPGLEPYAFPTNHGLAPRLATAWTPNGSRSVSLRAAYGTFHDNHLTSLPGVTDIVDGSATGVRTLVTRFPATRAAWNSPGHRLSEGAAGTYPSLLINVAPEFATPYAHHATTGVTWQLPGRASINADFIYVRGLRQVGTLDYNPVVPSLGPNRRPGDLVIGGLPVAGTSASVLQYTGFGDTWYKGLAVSLSKRMADRYQFLVSYTLSEAEDTSTDYQNAFLPEDTGAGRDPADPTGLPIGFDPLKEKGPSLEHQRHRFVLSGMTQLPGQVFLSSIVTAGSGRPYNILAGSDLNGDGNGGAFPPDRPRRVLDDPQSSIGRNLGALPSQATMDVRVSRRFSLNGMRSVEAIFEVFNLFNRTNFTESNPVFGAGPYPANPLSTFGQFEKAAPPRQAQIAIRVQL
jgi:hypothetical protein